MDVANMQNGAEIKTDLRLLLECLKCHMSDAAVQRDTLLTTAAICSSSDEAKEFFRECGGINFVLNLLTSTEDCKVKIAALYTLGCACEKNVFSQKRLCTPAVFKFLYCQLISKGEPSDSLKRTSAFLLLCLVTNNGEGQNMARTSNCLEALLKLFRTSYTVVHDTSGSPGQRWMDANTNCRQLDLWTTVTSALCGCVNNPQNEENQQMCASSAFPMAIDIISKTENPRIIRLVSSFLSLTIANSVSNQDRFGILGGMEVLVDLLHTIVEGLLKQPEQDAVQAAVQLANVFVSCITDSDLNHTRLVDLNLVPLLVQLMSMDFIESDVRLKVIITLGHLTEKCVRSQRQLVESDGLSLLVHTMAENQDEEFNKAAMYLLSSCVDLVSCMEREDINIGPDKGVLAKTKTVNKRDRARAERFSTYVPLRNQMTDPADVQGVDETMAEDKTGERELQLATDVIVTSTNGNIDSSSHPERNQTTAEALVIDNLLRQLKEEKRMRKQLEEEKGALELQEELREKHLSQAKEKAEAITTELETQYLEQRHSEIQEDGRNQLAGRQALNLMVSASGKQFQHPALKKMEEKLEMLEKRLQGINNMGNQLADQFIPMNQEKQTANGRDLSSDTTLGCKSLIDACQTVSDIPSAKRNLRDSRQIMNTKQLQDRVNMCIRSLNDSSDSLRISKSLDVTNTQKSPSAKGIGIFRVPTSTVQRHHFGASRRENINRLSMPSPNVIKRKRRSGDETSTKSYQECQQHKSEVESCMSDITDLSAMTDTDVSLSASDIYLMKQATAAGKHPNKGKVLGKKATDHKISSAQSKANQGIQVKYSFEKGETSTVPCSKRVSNLTLLGNTHPEAGKDNSTILKDGFTSRGSQSNLPSLSSGCSYQSALHSIPKCPGCAPPINRPLLNSRNFLYTLERSQHTCSEHRELQRLIKQDIKQRRMAQTNDTSPQSTESTISHLTRHLRSATRTKRCPLTVTPSLSRNSDGCHKHKTTISVSKRRKRQDFTPQEVHNLIEGVAKKGKHWNSILWGYQFAPGRTSVDLKDKYRRMQAQNYPGVIPHSTPTSCKSFEQRRRGVTKDCTWRP